MPDRCGEENEPTGYAHAADSTAIASCELCDDNGIRLNQATRCDHTDYAAAARRGMKLIRQALAHRYTNPDHPAVADALTRRCDQCGAPPGQPCHNHIAGGGPLPGRTVHHGRTEAP